MVIGFSFSGSRSVRAGLSLLGRGGAESSRQSSDGCSEPDRSITPTEVTAPLIGGPVVAGAARGLGLLGALGPFSDQTLVPATWGNVTV